MKARWLLVLGMSALYGAGCFAQTPALDSPELARKKYDTYKARVMGGDLTVDWREFRLDAAVASVNGSFDWQSVRNSCFQALHEGKNDAVLAGAEMIVAHNMASADGHMLLLLAQQKLGHQDEALKQDAILKAIVKSILDSGDGKSAATAWFTVDPSEEYFLIGAYLGDTPKAQALVNQNGHSYDRMTVVDRDGKEQVLWFNTDTDLQLMDRAIRTTARKK